MPVYCRIKWIKQKTILMSMSLRVVEVITIKTRVNMVRCYCLWVKWLLVRRACIRGLLLLLYAFWSVWILGGVHFIQKEASSWPFNLQTAPPPPRTPANWNLPTGEHRGLGAAHVLTMWLYDVNEKSNVKCISQIRRFGVFVTCGFWVA